MCPNYCKASMGARVNFPETGQMAELWLHPVGRDKLGAQRLGTGWSSGGPRKGPVPGLCSEHQVGICFRVSTSLRLESQRHSLPWKSSGGQNCGFLLPHSIKKSSSNSQCLGHLWSQANQGHRGISDPPKAVPQRQEEKPCPGPLSKGKTFD